MNVCEEFERIFYGNASVESIILSTCTPDALGFLAIIVCNSCGYANSRTARISRCRNCTVDFYTGWCYAYNQAGRLVCQTDGHNHNIFPTIDGIHSVNADCGTRTLLKAVRNRSNLMIVAFSNTIWMQVKNTLLQNNSDYDYRGNPQATAETFYNNVVKILNKVATDIIEDTFPGAARLTEKIAAIDIDNYMAWINRLSTIPGEASRFKVESLVLNQDFFLKTISSELLKCITGTRLLDNPVCLAEFWPKFDVTFDIKLEILLNEAHEVIGSEVLRSSTAFTEVILKKQSRMGWQIDLPEGPDLLRLKPSSYQTSEANKILQGHFVKILTPSKIVDQFLPERTRIFKIFSTPKNEALPSRMRSQLSDVTINRINHLYPHAHNIKEGQKLDVSNSRLLFRQDNKDVLAECCNMFTTAEDNEVMAKWYDRKVCDDHAIEDNLQLSTPSLNYEDSQFTDDSIAHRKWLNLNISHLSEINLDLKRGASFSWKNPLPKKLKEISLRANGTTAEDGLKEAVEKDFLDFFDANIFN